MVSYRAYLNYLILNIEEPQEIKVNKTYIENNIYQSFFFKSKNIYSLNGVFQKRI